MPSVPRLEFDVWSRLVKDDDGTLPDGDADSVGADGWQAVLDAIERQPWRRTVEVGGNEVVWSTATELLARRSFELVVVKVWLHDYLQVNLFLLSPDSIDFDFDRRQLVSQQSLDELCEFVRVVGQAVRRDFVLAPEGSGRGGPRYVRYLLDADAFELG